jgi:hypothetical protein
LSPKSRYAKSGGAVKAKAYIEGLPSISAPATTQEVGLFASPSPFYKVIFAGIVIFVDAGIFNLFSYYPFLRTFCKLGLARQGRRS